MPDTLPDIPDEILAAIEQAGANDRELANLQSRRAAMHTAWAACCQWSEVVKIDIDRFFRFTPESAQAEIGYVPSEEEFSRLLADQLAMICGAIREKLDPELRMSEWTQTTAHRKFNVALLRQAFQNTDAATLAVLLQRAGQAASFAENVRDDLRLLLSDLADQMAKPAWETYLQARLACDAADQRRFHVRYGPISGESPFTAKLPTASSAQKPPGAEAIANEPGPFRSSQENEGDFAGASENETHQLAALLETKFGRYRPSTELSRIVRDLNNPPSAMPWKADELEIEPNPLDIARRPWLLILKECIDKIPDLAVNLTEEKLRQWLRQNCKLPPTLDLNAEQLVELLERAVTLPAGAETTLAATPPTAPPHTAGEPTLEIDLEAQALALLFQQPDWSILQITKHLKVDRRTPYKWDKFRKAAEAAGRLKPRGRKDRTPHRGHKTRDGQVDAYAHEDEDE